MVHALPPPPIASLRAKVTTLWPRSTTWEKKSSLGQREVVHRLLARIHDGASDATQERAASAMVPHKAPPAPQTKASGDDWPDFQAFLAGTPPKKMEQKHYADAAEERAVAALQALDSESPLRPAEKQAAFQAWGALYFFLRHR